MIIKFPVFNTLHDITIYIYLEINISLLFESSLRFQVSPITEAERDKGDPRDIG